MIGCSAGANSASAHTLDDLLIGNLNVENYVHLHAHSIQRLCLRNGAGETVKDEAVAAGFACKLFVDNADNDLIRNQLTCVDITLCRLTKLRTLLNSRAENISCCYCGNVVLCRDVCGLSSLARAGRT